MPVYVKCHKCGSKIRLGVKRKYHLPIVFNVTCPYCGFRDTYTRSEAFEEDIYEFICPICRRKFYITRKPPIRVECPYCHTRLYIKDERTIDIERKGTPPPPTAPITGLIGAVLGSLLSKNKGSGVLVGGVMGVLAGLSLEYLTRKEAMEAIYLD